MRSKSCCRSYRRVLLVAVVSCCSTAPRLNADAVNGEVFTVTQPDGAKVDVRVWGDEFYHVVESLDGYALVLDAKTRTTCYARLSPEGDELISTGVPVAATAPEELDLEKHIRISRVSARQKIAEARGRLAADKAEALAALGAERQYAPPVVGNIKGIVLLVDFSDQPATIATSEIDDYCNKVGYTGYSNNGSVRDYFYDVSDGNLTYTNFVPTTYYRATNPKSWYDDSSTPCCSRARTLVIEALNDLNSQGFDFSEYDSDLDGRVDALNILYAGTRNGPWNYGLWPHSSWLTWSADGVSTGPYQITDIGTQLRLRTFCHENGHMVCDFPDLYDYGYESTGVGNFCLMCYGASDTNPAEPCAYMKYIAGWSNTTILAGQQLGLSAPSGVNVLYKFEHPTASNEYYLIENRQKSGRDTYIPDAGLAIWHIDTYGNNDWEDMTPERHYEVTLVQADGYWDLENNRDYGDSTDLWSAPGYDECTPDTNPNTNWWDGSTSDLFVTEIGSSVPTMTFDFLSAADCNNNGTPDFQDIAGGSSDDDDGNGVPDECECLALSDPPQPASPAAANNRYLSIVPGNTGEQTALRVVPVDLPTGYESLVGTDFWVGAPQAVSEESGSTDQTPPTFTAATLACDPVYQDWGSYGTVHVYDEVLVPGGLYEIQMINQICFAGAESNYSEVLPAAAPEWGDVVGDCSVPPCTAPDGVIDFNDIASVVDKFKNLPGAPIKARADLAPRLPDRIVDFVDLPRMVDAFRSLPYPYEAPTGCP